MARKKVAKYLKAKNKLKDKNKPEPGQTTTAASRLTYEQSLRLVEITNENKLYHLSIVEPLEMVKTHGLTCRGDPMAKTYISKRQTDIQLPNINVETVSDNDCSVIYGLPSNYRIYQERNDFETLVEYDIDEEDIEWLALLNAKRKKESLNKISYSQFERVMDCLEKESFFQVCISFFYNFVFDAQNSTFDLLSRWPSQLRKRNRKRTV
jgi:hypothetical protein